MPDDNPLPPIGQKFYITAKASKTGYEDSEMGSEGAFRTVIHYDNPANNKDNGNYGTIKDLKFFATDSPEGPLLPLDGRDAKRLQHNGEV